MPIRFLRPGIRTSPRWNSVSHRAARLYIAILTLVDDYGRYDGRPSVLWAESFAVFNDQNPPQDAISLPQVAADCTQLASARLLEFYEVDGKKFLQVTQWQERPRGKSKWPDPIASKLPQIASELRASCGEILPPSPSPSPSPIVVSSGVDTDQENDQQAVPESAAKKFFADLRKDIESEECAAAPKVDSSIEAFKQTIGMFLKRTKTAWSYDEEYLAAEIVRRDWVAEWTEIRRYLDNLPDNKREFEPALRGFKKLVTEWPNVLDRSRMTNNSDKQFNRELDRLISNAKRVSAG